MAITVRKNSEEIYLAIAYAYNTQQSVVSQSLADGYIHRDATQVTNSPLLSLGGVTLTTITVSAAAATSLATSITLANQIFGVLNVHLTDDQVHLTTDFVNLPSLDGYMNVLAVDLPTVEVLLNAEKALFNAHLTQSGVHQINDVVNTVVAANATSQSTANTLANALKTAVNAHMASCPTGSPRIRFTAD